MFTHNYPQGYSEMKFNRLTTLCNVLFVNFSSKYIIVRDYLIYTTTVSSLDLSNFILLKTLKSVQIK